MRGERKTHPANLNLPPLFVEGNIITLYPTNRFLYTIKVYKAKKPMHKHWFFYILKKDSAEGGTRTHTGLGPTGF